MTNEAPKTAWDVLSKLKAAALDQHNALDIKAKTLDDFIVAMHLDKLRPDWHRVVDINVAGGRFVAMWSTWDTSKVMQTVKISYPADIEYEQDARKRELKNVLVALWRGSTSSGPIKGEHFAVNDRAEAVFAGMLVARWLKQEGFEVT